MIILPKNWNGGARRDRTADLNTASVALSQLSYSPFRCFVILYLSFRFKNTANNMYQLSYIFDVNTSSLLIKRS